MYSVSFAYCHLNIFIIRWREEVTDPRCLDSGLCKECSWPYSNFMLTCEYLRALIVVPLYEHPWESDQQWCIDGSKFPFLVNYYLAASYYPTNTIGYLNPLALAFGETSRRNDQATATVSMASAAITCFTESLRVYLEQTGFRQPYALVSLTRK